MILTALTMATAIQYERIAEIIKNTPGVTWKAHVPSKKLTVEEAKARLMNHKKSTFYV